MSFLGWQPFNSWLREWIRCILCGPWEGTGEACLWFPQASLHVPFASAEFAVYPFDIMNQSQSISMWVLGVLGNHQTGAGLGALPTQGPACGARENFYFWMKLGALVITQTRYLERLNWHCVFVFTWKEMPWAESSLPAVTEQPTLCAKSNGVAENKNKIAFWLYPVKQACSNVDVILPIPLNSHSNQQGHEGFTNKESRGEKFKRLPWAHMATSVWPGCYSQALCLQGLSFFHFATLTLLLNVEWWDQPKIYSSIL